MILIARPKHGKKYNPHDMFIRIEPMNYGNVEIIRNDNIAPAAKMSVVERRLTVFNKVADTCEKQTKRGAEMSVEPYGEAVSLEQLAVLVAKSKDVNAFKVLFDHFAPRLKSFLIKLGLNGEKSEELAQEVMVTLWQKAEMFDPGKAKLSTWIFRIARNKHIDLVRKQKYPMLNADDHMKHMMAPEQTDQPLEGKQKASRIKDALKRLKIDQQVVIKLSFFEELSHGQIAERLNLPLGTVKSRIRSAFQTLRQELGDFK